MEYQIHSLQLGILQTNCHIIENAHNKHCVIIDPAFTSKKLSKFLICNNLQPIAVLLTHGHFDHVGGVKDIVEKYHVPVFGNKMDGAEAAKASKNIWNVIAKDAIITNFIENGKPISIEDFEFEVLFTPGHTEGSVCYFFDDKYMFSGDTIFCGSIGRTDLKGGDMNKMFQSLNTIKNLERNYIILSGHGENTTLFEEKKTNSYLSY